jgi:DNA-directed RNA polymerase subunit RPC12/RpoP
MSEFKYACPVCGQHMMCDTSQGGSVMECPTCFQKIVAPQAPTSIDNKLILTGTKFSEKRTSDPFAGIAGVRQEKRPYVAVIIFLVIVGAAAGAIFKYHDQLLKYVSTATGQTVAATNPPANQTATPVPPPKPEKPVAVAPPANDTNWTLVLAGVTNFPDTPVAGRIHGQDFITGRAFFQNGTLTLRDANRGPIGFGCTISFEGVSAETLSGKSINVTTNADTAARVTLHWKDDDVSSKASFNNGYAMQIQFGTLEKNHLPGKIYLCTPDPEKTYLLGTFNADARKPKPKAPKN